MIKDYRPTQESANEVYNNGLLIRPTSFDSMYRAGQGGFITGYKFADDAYRKAFNLPKNTQLEETMQLIQRETHFKDQPFNQTASNFVADMIGYGINPITIGLTTIGAGVGGLAFKGLTKIAPKAITPFLEKTVGMVKHPTKKELVPLTVGEIGKRLTVSGSAGIGAGLPIAFGEGSATDAFMMGGIGMVFSSIPIALGMFRKAAMKPSVAQEAISEVKLEVNPEIKQWIEDYESKSVPLVELEKRATKLLQNEGLEVDAATNKLPMHIISESNINNLQIAASDSLTANMEKSTSNYLIDYIVKNSIDELRSNPKSIKMIQAYDNFLTGKLAQRAEITATADMMHAKNMEAKLNKGSLLSQPEIYKVVKKFSREESHVSQLPFTMPENLERRIKIEDKISKLKQKPENKQISRRITELEKKLPELMSPKRELEHIRHKLLEKKGYENKLQSREYHRLEELSEHWPQAKSLLERINLEEAFEKQTRIKEVLDQMRKVIEAPIDRMANPDNVIKYFKERLNLDKPKFVKPEKSPEQIIESHSKVPSDVDSTVKEYMAMASESSAKKLREETILVQNKITQFNNSQNIFSDLIECMIEAR